LENAPIARAATAFTPFCAPGRSLQSRSRTKAMPAFWPLPEKEKPAASRR
jgi:hypothetical protein